MGQELIDGATLTGEIPVTGVLDTKLKPARIDIDELMSISDQVKQQIRSRTVVFLCTLSSGTTRWLGLLRALWLVFLGTLSRG